MLRMFPGRLIHVVMCSEKNMKIYFNWNDIGELVENKSLIEENMRNEITNSYQDFEVSAERVLVSLHNDSRSNSIIGSVIGKNEHIDMTVSYSTVSNHTATYTLQHD